MLTWVEINKQALNYNLKQFRKLIGPKVALMPVIKSNAYGHGFLEIAKLCEINKEVDGFCVASLEEALTLRRNDIKQSILIMTFYELSEKNIKMAIKNNITFSLYTIKQARRLNKIGERCKKHVKTHLKLDIGTSRIGILPNELNTFIDLVKKMKYISIEGVMGHFASSEDDPITTKKQINNFNSMLATIRLKNLNLKLVHTACSAATILYKNAHYNGIRLGLSLYGLYPSKPPISKIVLKPVLSWHTTIIQVKTISKNTKISYGGTYTTDKTTRIATIPVGYWDGYDRAAFGNRAHVLINGHRCPVRGRICMNLTMVDVTKVKNVKEGDTATLIGEQDKAKVSADELTQLAESINYEIVTRINPLLPRIVV